MCSDRHYAVHLAKRRSQCCLWCAVLRGNGRFRIVLVECQHRKPADGDVVEFRRCCFRNTDGCRSRDLHDPGNGYDELHRHAGGQFEGVSADHVCEPLKCNGGPGLLRQRGCLWRCLAVCLSGGFREPAFRHVAERVHRGNHGYLECGSNGQFRHSGDGRQRLYQDALLQLARGLPDGHAKPDLLPGSDRWIELFD